MAGTIATAYVQVMPSTEGITHNLEEQFGGAGEKAGEKGGALAGKGFLGKLGKALVAAGAFKAVTDFFKAAVKQGAELQQNIGGTQAVFGKAAIDITSRASQAYKNMGLSASDYMATANKMGALFQGSGLSQVESMRLTTKAMQRAADVASVMGIDTVAAMDAIAGAAKGNFTMMDNLGVAMNATTLQAYALEKGINFDWNTASQAEKSQLAMEMFFDRTSQYAGNFARESQGTISGSIGMLQASWSDFLAKLALGENVTETFKNVVRSVIAVGENLLPVIGNIFQGIGEVAMEYIGPAWENIKAGAASAWEGIKSTVASAWEGIKTAVSQKAAAVYSTASAKLRNLIGAAQGVWDTIAGAVSGAWSTIKSDVSIAVAPVVSAVSGPIEGLIGTVSSVWGAISSAVAGDWGPILSAVEGAVAPVVAAVSGPIESIIGTVSGVWSSIESGISSAWDGIKSALEKAVEPLKSVFNFSWSLPEIKLPKLPKLNVEMASAFGGAITYPKLSWNAKAMSNPYLFSGATLFGAGETGDEVLYGRTALMTDIGTAVSANATAKPTAVDSEILSTLRDLRDAMSHMGVYLDRDTLVGGIIENVDNGLGERDALMLRGLA